MMKQSNRKWTNEYWKLATWNVRGLRRKLEEVIQELGKCHTDVAIISETKRKGKVHWN
jgi:exonuclease III